MAASPVKLDPRYLSGRNQAKRQRLLQAVERGDVVNEPIPGEEHLTIGQDDETQFNIRER